MELLEFTHGEEPIKNRELFGLLGEYIASPAIRETLGGVISSEPGRLWFIMTEKGEARRVMSFGSLRMERAGATILHLYALEEGADIPVLEHCLESARENGATHLTTTDYWTKKELYLRYGFAPVRKIGRFVRFKKELERGD